MPDMDSMQFWIQDPLLLASYVNLWATYTFCKKMIKIFWCKLQTIQAACELELFDLVSQGEGGSNSAKAIAEQQGWHEDTLERLMDALVALKTLHKMSTSSGGQFSYYYKLFLTQVAQIKIS